MFLCSVPRLGSMLNLPYGFHAFPLTAHCAIPFHGLPLAAHCAIRFPRITGFVPYGSTQAIQYVLAVFLLFELSVLPKMCIRDSIISCYCRTAYAIMLFGYRQFLWCAPAQRTFDTGPHEHRLFSNAVLPAILFLFHKRVPVVNRRVQVFLDGPGA